jgi:hypothetical protein
MSRTFWIALIVFLTQGLHAYAGFVVVTNTTDSAVKFTVSHAKSDPRSYTVEPSEVKRVPVGRSPLLSFEVDGKLTHFRIEPYAAYVFISSKSGLGLQGIELAAPLPKPEDLPDVPPKPSSPAVQTIKILVDDADTRARAAWEIALRERVAEVSKLLERECGIALKVAETGTWSSDPQARTVAALLTDFENKVPPDESVVAVGFSSRPLNPLNERDRCGPGMIRGPRHSHVLVSEIAFATERERVELLAHQLAHLFGAAHTPDPLSLVRPTLGDGKSRAAKFRIGLDPLNALATGIWAEELQRSEMKGWGNLSPPAKTRLIAVYKTIARALPDDPLAKEFVAKLDHKLPAQAEVAPEASAITAKQQAVRKVVRAVTFRAGDLSRLPEGDRLKDDELTAELVRTAASVAATEEPALQRAALLVGLGLALDHTTTLRDNPLTRNFCQAVESDAERRERVAVLGSPTLRGRRDLCQHFVVSAALAELLEPAAAEAAGLLKERQDMAGASGYSFADLAANFAGIEFARTARRDPRAVARASIAFEIEEFIPDVRGLPEGLNRQRFEADFGSETDQRFRKMLDDIRRRVGELPGYNK